MTLTNDAAGKIVVLPEPPGIPGLVFRRFRGDVDFSEIFAVLRASKSADQVDDVQTLESLTSSYAHLVNCDPYQDMLFVEANGELVGYTRVFWQQALDSGRLYLQESFLLPGWRGKGIEVAMLRWSEQRLLEIAAQHPPDIPRFLQAEAWGSETDRIHLLEQAGYMPVRYFFEMQKPDLEDIPEHPVPEGLELRLVLPEHYRAIWEANNEAFRDHWDHVPYAEEDYQYWLHGDDEFQPGVWKVAWDIETNQVAGMVLGYILEEQNARFKRKRGWPADICVLRPWRRRGLARALIAETLREFKARGMREAALEVDTENLSGALRLYESMGFHTVKRKTVYRKPME